MTSLEELAFGALYYEPPWYPMCKRQLSEIRRYADMEATRLQADGPRRISINLRSFADGISGRDGVLWTIEQGHQPRKVDHAIYLFAKALALFGATAGLGSNQSNKASGAGQFYPLLRMKSHGRFSLMRVICDAQAGQLVSEDRRDFRNHLRQRMNITDLNRLWRSSKYVHGRADILDAAEKLHAESGPLRSAMISKIEFRALLVQLLHIADRHALPSS